MSKAICLTTLRTNASIVSTEYSDTQINVWLDDALHQHTKEFSFDTLPERQNDAIVLLSWIKVCYARASKASLYFSVGGKEGSTNKAEIVSSNLQLVTQLREEYTVLCGRLGINAAPEIIVSDATILDGSVNAETPTEAWAAPDTPVLVASAWDGTSVTLSWDEAHPRTSFSRYELYYGTEAGLEDLRTLGEDGIEHLGVSPTKAIYIRALVSIEKVCIGLTDLVAETDYYFVVVIVDINGRIAVSNEVSCGPSAPVPVPTPTLEYLTFFLGGTLTPDTDYIANVVFGNDITIKSVAINVQSAPSGDPLLVKIFSEAGGLGASFDTTVAAGATNGSNTGAFAIPTTKALFLRTGATTGGAVGANAVIGYELS